MKRTALLVVVVLSLLMLSDRAGLLRVHAQTGGGYDLTWSTIDSSGGTSSNGGYILDGTLGQPDVGTLSGGGYSLVGGFWGGALTQYRVYLPLIVRD